MTLTALIQSLKPSKGIKGKSICLSNAFVFLTLTLVFTLFLLLLLFLLAFGGADPQELGWAVLLTAAGPASLAHPTENQQKQQKQWKLQKKHDV